MPGTFFGIEISRRALQANKQAMNITGNNVANVNTAGYTRQEAIFSATSPLFDSAVGQAGLYALGTGVDLSEIRRVRDGYLDGQVRNNLSSIGYWQAFQGALGRIESVFPETTDNGLQNALEGFFSAWNDLSQNPDSLASKEVVREAGDALAGMIRSAYSQLGELDNDLQQELSGSKTGQIRQINDLAAQIADLNRDIVKAKKMGVEPSDLLDKREQLLENLAGLINISVTIEQDGSLTVQAGSKALVDGPGDQVDALLLDDIGSTITNPGGAVGALLDARNKISEYQASLNELADTLVNEVNSLNGMDNDGINFFEAGASSAAGIALSEQVNADPANINGRESLNIAKLLEKLTMADGSLTFEGFYRGKIVADIGSTSKKAGDNLDIRQATQEQLEFLRQSFSGVSLDEELTKMVQYQYAYQASARMIQTMDSMLATLMEMIG
jgi:flagellar hook-associated protein 1 FlgK